MRQAFRANKKTPPSQTSTVVPTFLCKSFFFLNFKINFDRNRKRHPHKSWKKNANKADPPFKTNHEIILKVENTGRPGSFINFN